MAIPGELIESELFGHEGGASNDAIKARVGRFVQASIGRLFLCEIGDLAQGMQVKLLRVLQERSFEAAVGNKTQRCYVFIIAPPIRISRLTQKRKNSGLTCITA